MPMQSLPLVLVPGLTCTARLYTPQVEALWLYGPVMIADHRRDADIAAVAKRILDAAPPRFALGGLSYGGYIAFEMMRQAADRIVKLALLDTSARADTPEQTAARETQIAAVEAGGYGEIADFAIARYLHRDHQSDQATDDDRAADGGRDGGGGFRARASCDHLAAGFAARCWRRSAVRLWCWSATVTMATPPDLAKEIAAGIPGSRLVIVPDCGHLSTIEQPAAVNAALAAWLDG